MQRRTFKRPIFGPSMSQALTVTTFMGLDSGLSRRASRRKTMPVAAAADSTQTPDQRRAAWMAAAQSGDRRVYEKLLADSMGLIRAAARRRGVAPDHVDDVVQETLITVHRVRHTYDPGLSYDAWITAIANRRAIDSLRSRGRRDSRELHNEFAMDNHPDHDDAAPPRVSNAPVICAKPSSNCRRLNAKPWCRWACVSTR
jgi:RNA polymerase sigma factor (sigma-70 family)